MNLSELKARLGAAWRVVAKGMQFPFNVVGGSDRRGANKMERPYETSVWVGRAIKKVAQPISAVPMRLSKDGRNGEVDLVDEEALAFWNGPAKGLSWFDFIEATVGWLNLEGEAFWVLDDTWLLPFPSGPSKLMFTRPDRMREVLEGNDLVGWQYRDPKGRQSALLPEQVIQTKFWNPYDDHRGLAPWLAARLATEADWYAANFNKNLWQNNGDRGPIIVGRNGMANDEQRQQIIDQLRAKRMAAQRGDFKPMFLTGDIEVQDPQVQTLDANAVATRLQNRHEIALAFGVPPSMFDVVASYSIGSASDRFMLIEETCMPLAEKIADSIEAVERKRSNDMNRHAWFDWDEHTTMQQVRSERIDSAVKLWQMGQPMRDINDYLKMGLKPYEGWDTGYLSFGLAPVSDVAGGMDMGQEFDEDADALDFNEEEEDQDEATEEVAMAVQAIRGALQQRVTDHGGLPPEPTEAEEIQEFQETRPRKERQIWLSHMASRAKVVRAYQSKFNRVLMKARTDTLRRLEGMDQSKSIQGKAITEMAFDDQTFKRGLVLAMNNVAGFALQEAGEQVFAEMAALSGEPFKDPWKTPPAEVIKFNRLRENKIVNVGDQIFQKVNDAVQEGLKLGNSVDQIAREVRVVFNQASKARSKTIALTETAAAYGQGRQVAAKATGAKYKQWMSSGLPNMRLAHKNANNQVVPIDEAFDVGGEALMHPGDPSGSARNVINCHCVSVPLNTSKPIT